MFTKIFPQNYETNLEGSRNLSTRWMCVKTRCVKSCQTKTDSLGKRKKCLNVYIISMKAYIAFKKWLTPIRRHQTSKKKLKVLLSLLPVSIINSMNFMFTLASLGLTIFAQTMVENIGVWDLYYYLYWLNLNTSTFLQGNTDLNIFLCTTSGCAISLCLLEVSFCFVEFIAICRKVYTVLLACSSLVAIYGIILYFLIGLGYAFFVIMTFVMKTHPKNVNVYLIVNLGFYILVRSIALSWVWWLHWYQ